MSELRLVPLAALMWACTALVVFRLPWIAIATIVLSFVGALVLKQCGQSIVLLCGGVLSFALTSSRIAAATIHIPHVLHGVVVEHPRRIREGTWMFTMRSEEVAADLPVISRVEPPPAGAVVQAHVQVQPSDRPGIVQHILVAKDLHTLSLPDGWQAATAYIRTIFAQASEQWLSVDARGLVPGMVLGDTNMQSEIERQLYIDTGLSHLTAVSGSNVAIVITAALLLGRSLTLSPRYQVVVAGISLLGFLGLVGGEPSVLRAGITGVVGLLTLINSSKMQPIHGLSIAICVLMIWDSNLAVQYGFLLSVAATAGIVALQPVLVPPLARITILGRRLPEILVRALGVAIAADLVTAPIIAMMSGKVPLVSVLANLLVAPVVGVITIAGLVAVGLSLIPGDLERIPFLMIDPCARWIHIVAEHLVGPQVSAPTTWICLACVWVAYGFYRGYGRFVLGAMLVAVLSWHSPTLSTFRRPAAVPLDQLNVVVEQSIADDYVPPAGTQVVVVLEKKGRRKARPTITNTGVPVLYPNRDGAVAVLEDGTQAAEDGRF